MDCSTEDGDWTITNTVQVQTDKKKKDGSGSTLFLPSKGKG